ncbi:MAG: hypothetical protein QM802_14020 [Agriterribacter sp.]
MSPVFCFALKWKVGPGELYTLPSQVAGLVNDGDTVEIEAAEYLGDVCVWPKNNLVLIGVNGMPHLRANGNYAAGKGIWVFDGNNITADNIEFSEASVPDQNGAGIRLDGVGINVMNCYFHNNENGILTNNNGGKIVVEHCEFGYNGDGQGYAHNIYIGHVDTALIRFSYFHHANVGHEFKSRARVNYILYNRFSDEATGTASRNIDLPNGGLAYIIGNIIEQGPQTENSNMVGYGLEGLTNATPHELYIINNTLVNDRNGGSFLQADDGTQLIKVYNNIFAGNGTVLIFGGQNTIIDSATNIVQPDKSLMGFANANAYDYHLTASSPAVDAGTQSGVGYNNFSLVPAYEYQHPTGSATRTNIGVIDIGAYELSQSLPLNIVDISAIAKEVSTLIEWKTEFEHNINVFELQRSPDGISFKTIATINANNKAENNYAYTDTYLSGDINYYRLKIVEQDGFNYFSNIVSVKLIRISQKPKASVNGSTLTIFNIPASFKNANTLLQLYDYGGRKIYDQRIVAQDSRISVSLPGAFIQQQLLILVLSKKDDLLVIQVSP